MIGNGRNPSASSNNSCCKSSIALLCSFKIQQIQFSFGPNLVVFKDRFTHTCCIFLPQINHMITANKSISNLSLLMNKIAKRSAKRRNLCLMHFISSTSTSQITNSRLQLHKAQIVSSPSDLIWIVG
ncbi:hypothetical protein ACB098_01G128400 [Castanea mollissima]